MKYFDKIERRLKGEMSESEEKAFDQELQENKELAEEYELQKIEEDILDFAVEEDLLARIRQIKKEKADVPTVPKKTIAVKKYRWRRSLTAIAASLVILIAAYYAVEYNNNSGTPKDIALTAYRQMPPNLSLTKAIDNNTEAWETNKQFLLSKENEKVISATSFFENEKKRTPEAAYYLGHGYWNLEDYDKALMNFEYFLDNSVNDDRLVPLAEYYKSLALLASNREDDAREFILAKKIGHPFEKPWNELLKNLK